MAPGYDGHPFPLSNRREIVVHGPMLAFSLQKSQPFILCDTEGLIAAGTEFSGALIPRFHVQSEAEN